MPHIPKQIKRTKKWWVWPIQDVQRRIGRDICQRLLFIHAFSSCDTTACPYGMGKGTILSKVMNNLVLGKCADTLTDVNSTREDVIEAGDLVMRLLTGGNGIDTLAGQCYMLVKAETLTATSGSTKQHSLRTYHQVMAWQGLDLPPDKYGFRILDGKYLPFSPNFLLLQMPFWSHSFVIVKLIATRVDALAGSTICHAWICVVYAITGINPEAV